MTFRSPNAQPELLSSKGILSRGSTSALSEAGPDGSGYDNRKLVQDFLTIHCILRSANLHHAGLNETDFIL
jgi:hypothetical protein